MSEQPVCWVGFDTSNYTTSAAACTVGADGHLSVIANCKVPLPVAEGARGLRQSDAVFAHTRNLPQAIRELRTILEAGHYRVAAVGYSAKPRDAEDSYMPCFLTGKAVAEAFAAGCHAPVYAFSHQSGHITAALYSSGALREGQLLSEPRDGTSQSAPFLAFHVSGGTTEVVIAHPHIGGFSVELIGGGADLHAGQVIDRVGVMMGLKFPCGREMEQLAMTNQEKIPPLKVCVRDGQCHLSGLENQAADLWAKTQNAPLVSAYVLAFIGKTLRRLTEQAEEKAAARTDGDGTPLYPKPLPVVYAGGVMSNHLIRPALSKKAPWRVYFSEPAFSADNAAGVSLLCAMQHMAGEQTP